MDNDVVGGCIILGVLFLFIALVLCLPFVHLSSVGKGQHTGYVTAVDQRGFFFPNYVVYFKTDTSSSQEDDYCVFRGDAKVADELKEAAKKKERVTIAYHGVRAFGIGICDGTQIDEVVKE